MINNNLTVSLFVLFFIFTNTSFAQDTIKIKKNYLSDEDCKLILCFKKQCLSDSIPAKLFLNENNIELRISEKCQAKKKFDVFVSSFELWIDNNGKKEFSTAQSSFFTDIQKRSVQNIKSGGSFVLKNIVVHAPDGFKKMDDLYITVIN